MFRFAIPWITLSFLVACTSTPTRREVASASADCAGLFDPRRVDIPPTHTDNVVMSDPYRWLEGEGPGQRAWLGEQSRATQKYLAGNPQRKSWEKFFSDLWDHKNVFGADKGGEIEFTLVDRGLGKSSDVMMKKKGERAKILLRSIREAKNGTVAYTQISASPKGDTVVVVSVERGSLDDHRLIVIDTGTGKIRETLTGTDGGITWISPREFIYGQNFGVVQQVFRHRVGTPRSADNYWGEFRNSYYNTASTRDKQWALYPSPENSSKQNLRRVLSYKDYEMPEQVDDVLGHVGKRVFFRQSGKKNRGKVVFAEIGEKGLSELKTLVTEGDMQILSARLVDERLRLIYQMGKEQKVEVLDLDGKVLASVRTPDFAEAYDAQFDPKTNRVSISFSSPIVESKTLTYDLATGKYIEGEPRELLLRENGVDYVVEYISVRSRDGASVPVRLTYKSGLVRDGKTPALIEGYGGFGVQAYFAPGYSPASTEFVRRGGIHIAPALRGGGENGETWHQQGALFNKQNVFNDLIATTEAVQAQGYTSPEKTAVMGWSNGGLLVGATVIQRPELFKLAIPGAGVQDMLRRDVMDARFIQGWSYEYGYLSDAQVFQFVQGYSPVHNARPGNYPMFLIPVGTNDSRVAAAHSKKLAAALQAAQKGPAPILLMATNNSGHWLTKEDLQDIIGWRRSADIWSTIGDVLGLQSP